MKIDKCYIGANVSFDGIRPDLIEIGENTTITKGTVILSHFYDSSSGNFTYAKVKIGANCFIGMNVLIIKPVTIGKNSVIGAGSVLTRDVGDYELWAGNPAKLIKMYEKSSNN